MGSARSVAGGAEGIIDPSHPSFLLTGTWFSVLSSSKGLWELIFELRELPGAYSRAPGASGSLFSSSGSFRELIFELWELPGAYIQPQGASGSLFSASRSFRELIFNLQELPGAYFQPPGPLVVPRASKIPSNEASKTQIGSAGVAKRKQLERRRR